MRTARLLAAMAASALVAAMAGGFGLLAPAARLDGAAPWAMRLYGLVAAAGGLALLLRWRRRMGGTGRTDPAVHAVKTAATIMAALAVLALLAPRLPVPDASPAESLARIEQVPEPGAERPRPRQFRPTERERRASFPATGEDDTPGGVGFGNIVRRPGYTAASDPALPDLRTRLLLLGIILGIVALIGLLVVWRRMRLRAEELAEAVPVSAAEAATGLASSLEEVAYEGSDPRRQVTAAYHRLLAALADAGAPRLPQEAPHEHLNRVLGPLGVPVAPMHTLAGLYTIAQFSARPVTDAHRASAAEALLSALASLRDEPGDAMSDRTAA